MSHSSHDTAGMIVQPGDNGYTSDEMKFGTLNKLGFVRGQTAEHQWMILVNEACEKSTLTIDEMVRDYLVVMLRRFMSRVEFFDQLSAFDLYKHYFGAPDIDESCLQEVADISLQYVAFFPEQSGHRHQMKSVDFVCDLGSDLYRELAIKSNGKEDWFSQAYTLMAQSFWKSAMVLRQIIPRFTVAEKITSARSHRDALQMFTKRELARIAPAAEIFDQMYFKQKVVTTGLN